MMKFKFLFLMIIFFILLTTSCRQPIDGQIAEREALAQQALPQIWIDAPLNNSILPMEPYKITIHGSDPIGIASFEIRINGQNIANIPMEDTSQTLAMANYYWTPPIAGTYTVQVRTVNTNNIWSNDASVYIVVEGASETSSPTVQPQPEENITITLSPTTTLSEEMRISETPTTPQTVTLTPQLITQEPTEIYFSVAVSDIAIYYGGCSPRFITFDVEVTNNELVTSVLLFTRIEDTTSGIQTDWSNPWMMNELGNGQYQKRLTVDEIPNNNGFTKAQLLYQFVSTDANGEVNGRSQTFDTVLIAECATPTPQRITISPTSQRRVAPSATPSR